MRRTFLTLALAALAACLLLATSAAAQGPTLGRGGEAKFPHRSFLLTLPAGSSAEPTDVRVYENGDAVHELKVQSAGAVSDGELGTVLVIDASSSMAGEPIEQAMAAARAFAEHRPPEQKLGVVTFNRSARVLLEPTTDAARIDAALAKPPPLAGQTRVRDGTMTGLQTLQRANVRVGNVIVLSDGADTGSRATGKAVADEAGAHGVRVFTVGLESEHFEERTLSQLAESTGGEYQLARTAEDLDGIYDDLGERLANEYLVEYSSVAGPGSRVDVEATVEGVDGSATLTYTSPDIAAAPLPPSTPKANGFWGSAAAMVVVGFGAAFLLCFAAASLVLARNRADTPEERVAAFVAMGHKSPARPDDPQRDRLYERMDRGLRGRAWWRRFCVEVEIGRIDRKPPQIVFVTAVVTLLVMVLFAKVSGALWVALFALLIPIGVRKLVAHRASRQRILFGEQLADNLQVLASAMRAGQSFGGALAVAVEDAPEPAKREFERVVADEQLGVPLESSLSVVVDRMDNRDLHQVVLVASLQREAGGNSAEVLDRVADTIRERVSLRRLIATLTAQGRLSRWVVSLVPVGLVMFIGLTKPGYLDPLFHTTIGNVLLGVAAVMMVSGSLIIKKIVTIKV